jgi:uncharacterized membrane protein YhaH (DUF805 family)
MSAPPKPYVAKDVVSPRRKIRGRMFWMVLCMWVGVGVGMGVGGCGCVTCDA